MVYQQIVGIHMCKNCAPLQADLVSCYEGDCMFHLHKSKRYDLIDMFNDTTRYIDDNKPPITLNSTDLQLNKANSSDKETYY